jgi:transcriptional antiterminator NusG
MNWYIVRTFAKKESKVKEEIQKKVLQLGLSDLVEDVYIPTQNVVNLNNKKKKQQTKVMYSGYVFIKTSYNHKVQDMLAEVKDCMGFLTMSKTNRQPVPVNPSEMNQILGYKDSDKSKTVEVGVKVGDYVQIVSGPLKGYEGMLMEVFEGKLRGTVHLNIFGRITPTDVDIADLEEIKLNSN